MGPVSGRLGAFPGCTAHLSCNSRWVAYTTTLQLGFIKFKISLARVISSANSSVYLHIHTKKNQLQLNTYIQVDRQKLAL